AELAAAREIDAGRVQLLRAVAPEVAGRADRIAGLQRLGRPVLAAVRRQVAGRVQRPLPDGAVGLRDVDVVADVRVLPPDARDDALDLAGSVRVELGREGVVGERAGRESRE